GSARRSRPRPPTRRPGARPSGGRTDRRRRRARTRRSLATRGSTWCAAAPARTLRARPTRPARRRRPLRHRHDTDAARLRSATDVVAERDGGVLHLALLRLSLELLVVLVDHPHAGGARRVAEGLETAVRVHGQLPAQLEGARGDVLLRGT